jgi:hypothetical protein
MTEYELLDLMASASDQMADMFSLYLTILSAYLLVAYFVGEKLGRFQVIAVSGLFLFASSGQALGIRMNGIQIAEILKQKAEISPLTPYETGYVANTNVWVVAMIVGILIAILFMWQVRRAKK